jgi:hypothetical protein
MRNSKSISKTNRTKPQKETKESPQNKESMVSKPESLFDFGGLPSRDLKKNLGCG